MAKIRIAVAGAGLIGRRHIEGIRKNPKAQLASIVDPSPHAAEVAKTETVRLYPSLRDMIVSDRPDGVILATPNRFHVKQALECRGYEFAECLGNPAV
jgi:predicted dehydrogenase